MFVVQFWKSSVSKDYLRSEIWYFYGLVCKRDNVLHDYFVPYTSLFSEKLVEQICARR